MEDVPFALGIDVGTTNIKVALTDVGGADLTIRAVASAPTPAPARLAEVLAALIKHVLADRPPPDAIGIASMAETGVPLAADGAPVGDWLRWDGHRAGAEADELAGRLGWAELVRATGTRPGPKVPLATWLWLRRKEPERFAALARWAGVADFAGLLLTGRLATDHTLAGRTMAYRRPADGAALAERFDPDLLAEVGLRPDQLPDVVPAGVSGAVRESPFTVIGLRPGTPVTIAGHDHAVAAYGAGVRRPGEVADSIGTAEALLTIVATAPDPVAVGRAGMSSVVAVDGVTAAVLAGSAAAGALVQWWLEHDPARTPADELFAAVERLGPAPVDVLVLPYLHGQQTPAPDPAARLLVPDGSRDGSGDGSGDEPARGAKAMLQALCLQARWILAEQARLAGLPDGAAGPITVLGAPIVANPSWQRLKAAVGGRPLRLITEGEATAAGAALLA